MFCGRRAWFSRSVSPALRELWEAEGGTLARREDAHYLFSSDAAHPDTQRIHESQDYLDGRATVFHSGYLSAWANTSSEMKQSVVLGHFILPPACLQEEIRRKIGSFIWEQMDEALVEKQSQALCRPLDPLMQPAPSAFQNRAQREVMHPSFLPQNSSERKADPRETNPGEFAYHALQEYPVNNMVTGYTSARDMNKYAGELRDFTPGTSGYAAYWIQNDTKIRSGAKNKRKR
ncbi:TERB2 protein, partial [Eudromia elegans]|nr:TERB2 protein [Eudromia elegans]